MKEKKRVGGYVDTAKKVLELSRPEEETVRKEIENVCCDCARFPCARYKREQKGAFNRVCSWNDFYLGRLFDWSCWIG